MFISAITSRFHLLYLAIMITWLHDDTTA